MNAADSLRVPSIDHCLEKAHLCPKCAIADPTGQFHWNSHLGQYPRNYILHFSTSAFFSRFLLHLRLLQISWFMWFMHRLYRSVIFWRKRNFMWRSSFLRDSSIYPLINLAVLYKSLNADDRTDIRKYLSFRIFHIYLRAIIHGRIRQTNHSMSGAVIIIQWYLVPLWWVNVCIFLNEKIL